AVFQKVLHLASPEKAEKIQEAVGKLNLAKGLTDPNMRARAVKAAEEEMEEIAPGMKLAGVATVFSGVALLQTTAELAKDPTLKNKLAEVKDAAGFTKELGGLLEKAAKGSELEKAAKILGGAAKAAGFVAGVAQVAVG